MDLRLLDSARHEIAHALVVAAVGWSIDFVTVDALRLSGRCSYWFHRDDPPDTCDELVRDLCVAMAPSVGREWRDHAARGQCDTDAEIVARITDRLFKYAGEDTARVIVTCGEFAHGVLATHTAAWARASLALALSGRLDGYALANIDPAFIPRRGADLLMVTSPLTGVAA